MIFITGGIFQGQEDCAKKLCGPEGKIADGACASLEEMEMADVVLNLHAWVRRLIEDGKDPIAYAGELFSANPDAIYTTVEVGSGIVPADPREREWREAAGRTGCLAAAKSDQVIRIVCGIAARIK